MRASREAPIKATGRAPVVHPEGQVHTREAGHLGAGVGDEFVVHRLGEFVL